MTQVKDIFHPRFMDVILTIILVMLSVFTAKIFFVDSPGYMQNMAKWLNLWADVNERIKQSQMEQEDGG
jgi:hypothetical protein